MKGDFTYLHQDLKWPNEPLAQPFTVAKVNDSSNWKIFKKTNSSIWNSSNGHRISINFFYWSWAVLKHCNIKLTLFTLWILISGSSNFFYWYCPNRLMIYSSLEPQIVSSLCILGSYYCRWIIVRSITIVFLFKKSKNILILSWWHNILIP